MNKIITAILWVNKRKDRFERAALREVSGQENLSRIEKAPRDTFTYELCSVKLVGIFIPN